jgi:hypothetical protein
MSLNYFSHINHFDFDNIINLKRITVCHNSPWNLMSRYENVLPTRSKVIDPSSGDIVVDQKLALIRPALRISSGFSVPSLSRFFSGVGIKKSPTKCSRFENPVVLFVPFQSVEFVTHFPAATAICERRNIIIKRKKKHDLIVSLLICRNLHPFMRRCLLPNKFSLKP